MRYFQLSKALRHCCLKTTLNGICPETCDLSCTMQFQAVLWENCATWANIFEVYLEPNSWKQNESQLIFSHTGMSLCLTFIRPFIQTTAAGLKTILTWQLHTGANLWSQKSKTQNNCKDRFSLLLYFNIPLTENINWFPPYSWENEKIFTRLNIRMSTTTSPQS